MKFKLRRLLAIFATLTVAVVWLIVNPESYESIFTPIVNTGAESGLTETFTADATTPADSTLPLATDVLAKLEIKGRAPKTGYSREEFYNGWPTVDGCNLRQKIIKREFGDTATLDGCNVISGEYDEPYSGEHKIFATREEISKSIQIDHVVALSDAWQKGAQNLDKDTRYQIATDPLNLLAVDASANTGKSDGDAATWLPSNKKFRCAYVARQVSVKYKYSLWVTPAEHDAIAAILANCPAEPAPGIHLP